MSKKVSKKPVAKKPVAKKPVAKKSVAKKPVAKKPVAKKPVAKSPVAKKPVAKSPVAKKPVAKKPVAKSPVAVSPVAAGPAKPVAAKPVAEPAPIVDSAREVALATNIALEMKRASARVDQLRDAQEIVLSRRPTTRAQGKDTVKFPVTDLREFKKLLLDARVRAMSGVSAMRATGFNEAEDHEADGGDGTNQTLRLQALGQMGSINRTIQQIDEALHRIDDGSYGVCTVCGQLIRKPRLLNQPFVLTCMECQNEMERGLK